MNVHCKALPARTSRGTVSGSNVDGQRGAIAEDTGVQEGGQTAAMVQRDVELEGDGGRDQVPSLSVSTVSL